MRSTTKPPSRRATIPSVARSVLSFLVGSHVLGFALAPARSAGATPFVYQTVDSNGTVGLHTSIEIDVQGNPCISYWDAANGDLKYASRRGATWTIQTVDATGVTGVYSSLALDALGNPRISYYDDTTDDLRLATKQGSVWFRETVDAPGIVGEYSSLAIDAQDNPRIAYRDATNFDLRYASKLAGAWSRESASTTGSVGQYSSIVLDNAGNPHISHYDNTNFDLVYSVKRGGVWVSEIADPGGSVGQFSSIALDAQENPHIAYYDFGGFDLEYAKKIDGAWFRETVDSVGSVGSYASLSLDGDGNPMIAYYDQTTDHLKFARRSGSAWIVETVDRSGEVGELCEIEIDALGNPMVSYYAGDTGDLKLAESGVQITSPAGGVSWAVGSLQTITWRGLGEVAISLSADGGQTFAALPGPTQEDAYALRVPHVPTRFARLKIERASPHAFALTDSFFSIVATIALSKFDSSWEDGGGLRLSWQTDPAPPTIEGYRLERSDAGFRPLHDGLLDDAEFVDLTAPRDRIARYRLVAVNGLGEEYVVGETASIPAALGGRDLMAIPNPAPGGQTRVLYRAPAEHPLGGRAALLDLAVFDTSGRRVATLASGAQPAGLQSVTWNGRDGDGRDVAAGTYLLRLSWGGGASISERIVVVR